MAHFRSIFQIFQPRYLTVMILGIVFSLGVWKIMTMDFRYAAALCATIIVCSVAMMAVSFIDDFLVAAFVCNIPLSLYGKWIAAQPIAIPAKGISVGLAEFLIIIAYFSWFFKIFVTREEKLPHLCVVSS